MSKSRTLERSLEPSTSRKRDSLRRQKPASRQKRFGEERARDGKSPASCSKRRPRPDVVWYRPTRFGRQPEKSPDVKKLSPPVSMVFGRPRAAAVSRTHARLPDIVGGDLVGRDGCRLAHACEAAHCCDIQGRHSRTARRPGHRRSHAGDDEACPIRSSPPGPPYCGHECW